MIVLAGMDEEFYNRLPVHLRDDFIKCISRYQKAMNMCNRLTVGFSGSLDVRGEKE
jgi:hypothetical protein